MYNLWIQNNLQYILIYMCYSNCNNYFTGTPSRIPRFVPTLSRQVGHPSLHIRPSNLQKWKTWKTWLTPQATEEWKEFIKGCIQKVLRSQQLQSPMDADGNGWYDEGRCWYKRRNSRPQIPYKWKLIHQRYVCMYDAINLEFLLMKSCIINTLTKYIIN